MDDLGVVKLADFGASKRIPGTGPGKDRMLTSINEVCTLSPPPRCPCFPPVLRLSRVLPPTTCTLVPLLCFPTHCFSLYAWDCLFRPLTVSALHVLRVLSPHTHARILSA